MSWPVQSGLHSVHAPLLHVLPHREMYPSLHNTAESLHSMPLHGSAAWTATAGFPVSLDGFASISGWLLVKTDDVLTIFPVCVHPDTKTKTNNMMNMPVLQAI